MSDAERFDAFERTGWSGRADAYNRGFARMTAHAVAPLLDAAGVAPGTRLLDVGCGPGPVTARAVGRGARVVSLDAEPDMARTTATRCPGTSVVVAALPRLPFPGGRFDAVVGGFVINHVGDPPAAARELARVLRPGGRLALTCWVYPAMRANAVFNDAVAAAGARAPDGVPTSGPFSPYAEPAAFTGLLDAAGFSDVGVDVLRWSHRVDPDRWWSDVLAGTCVNASVITSQEPEMVERIRREYRRAVRPYLRPDGTVELPAEALLARGRR